MHDSRTPFFRSGLLMLASVIALAGCGGSAGLGDVRDAGGAESASLFLAPDPLAGVPEEPSDGRPHPPGPHIDRLAEVLGLNEDQADALREAHAEFRAGLETLVGQVRSGELSLEEARAEAESRRDALEAEIQVILTEAQYDQLQEMRENRHRPGRGHGDPGRRWDAWLEEIGADEGQIASIKEALEALRDDLHDLHMRVRDGDLSREEAVELARQYRAAFDAELREILTAEQYEALQELRPDRCRGEPE